MLRAARLTIRVFKSASAIAYVLCDAIEDLLAVEKGKGE